MTDATTQAKLALRMRMKAALAGVGSGVFAEASPRICEALARTVYFVRADVVMLYAAMAGEVDVSALATAAWASGKKVCLPRVNWGEGTMTPALVTSWEALVTGRHGVREPGRDARAVWAGEVDLVVTPGLAFDALGGRLGRGAGFYDRFLASTRAARVGAGLDEQIVEAVPMTDTDARLDAVVTPTRVLTR